MERNLWDRAGLDCDEYPFACTREGANSGNWDYSVRLIDSRQNQLAGSFLGAFLTADRILADRDPFYVTITKDPPAPGIPAAGDDVWFEDDVNDGYNSCR
jgi:hypothetical protein